jgi:hypothetical protein
MRTSCDMIDDALTRATHSGGKTPQLLIGAETAYHLLRFAPAPIRIAKGRVNYRHIPIDIVDGFGFRLTTRRGSGGRR